ncbi:hypothetical protein CYY_010206 [Polysphondylium violaceum]|uniref:Uncharacterized protein n=1 Tax=Polysphondylium violaceum TaxID=133409 RepID=A0A8J4PJW7_9MYCE|nr:hypothetical protein CYY_010206 [Polysphondylium violaceum]
MNQQPCQKHTTLRKKGARSSTTRRWQCGSCRKYFTFPSSYDKTYLLDNYEHLFDKYHDKNSSHKSSSNTSDNSDNSSNTINHKNKLDMKSPPLPTTTRIKTPTITLNESKGISTPILEDNDESDDEYDNDYYNYDYNRYNRPLKILKYDDTDTIKKEQDDTNYK